MKPPGARAFTVVELLVVVAIAAILAAVSIPALQGMNNAGRFNQAVSGVAGLLELARSQAIAQNTYAWVVLYQNDPSSNTPPDNGSGYEVYAAAFLSNDGTDPFDWGNAAASVSLPGGTVGSTTLAPVARLASYRQTGLLISDAAATAATGHSLPNIGSAGSPAFPATSPDFQYKTPAVTLSASSSAYCLIEFTPSGAARNGSTPVESIWLGLYAVKGKQKTGNIANLASLKINGLTGLVTVYRQ